MEVIENIIDMWLTLIPILTIGGSIWNYYHYINNPMDRDLKFKLVMMLTTSDLLVTLLRFISIFFSSSYDILLTIISLFMFSFELSIFIYSWIFSKVLHDLIVKNKEYVNNDDKPFYYTIYGLVIPPIFTFM